MTVLTKQDLQDWNSNPVTRQIFEGIDASLIELRDQSCMCATSDETAMRVAKNEGIAEGINSLKDAYLLMWEDSE